MESIPIACMSTYTDPSGATAPMASSGWLGARILAGTRMSSAAPTRRAAAAATITPPLGIPRTRAPGQSTDVSSARRSPRSRPASSRS